MCKTREQWLNEAVECLKPMFEEGNLTLPAKLKVSCGWPSHKALAGAKGRVIGQCFKDICSETGHNKVFISPVMADAVEVLAVLVHELCHATDNCKSQHGPAFRKMMEAVGLTGKPTSTVAGDDLKVRLAAIAEVLGNYPHSTLDISKQVKRQSTRMIKAWCKECGYTVRLTRAWLMQAVPDCPLCGIEFSVEDF